MGSDSSGIVTYDCIGCYCFFEEVVMEDFLRLMTMIIDFWKTPFTVWGYTFSFWGVFMLVSVLSLVFCFICKIFSV